MNYAAIKKTDIANGEGVRVSLFVSGCTHHCKGCFNSVAWDHSYGTPMDSRALTELRDALSHDYISGLSILGGEPLDERNAPEVATLCMWFKREFPNKSLWVYTGDTWEEIFERKDPSWHYARHIVKMADVVVDGRFIEERKDISLHWRGSSNQRVIYVKDTLASGHVVLWEA